MKSDKKMAAIIVTAIMVISVFALVMPVSAQDGWYPEPAHPNHAPGGMPDFDQKQDARLRINCVPGIEVNKTVFDPETGEWVKGIKASINDTVRFRIEVHNNGTCCNLTNITVWDSLSYILEFADNATVNGEPCEPEIEKPVFSENFGVAAAGVPGGYLVWTYNSSEPCTDPFKELAPCETIVIEFDANVTVDCGCDCNYVEVQGYGCDEPVSDWDVAWVNVPGIVISKWTYPAERVQGEVFNFSIEVCPCMYLYYDAGIDKTAGASDGKLRGSNPNGFYGGCFDYYNNNIEYIDITDVLPDGLEYVSADPAPTSVMGNVIYWHFDNVTEELWEQLCWEGDSIELTVRVALNATGNLTDTAVASMKDTSGTVYNDATSFTVFVPPPGLHVTKNPYWQWCMTGQQATFIINATANKSLYTERQVVDTMPAGMQFVSSTPAPDAQIGNMLIWNVTDTHKNITLVVNFPGVISGLFKNVVEVKGKNATGVVHADKDYAYVSVSDKPDPIWVTKLPEEQTRNPGDDVIFYIETLVATNASTQYIITNDTLPVGLDYQTAMCTNGTPVLPTVYYDPVTGETVLTWNHTDFIPGENRTWKYVVWATVNTTVPPCTTLIERADGYTYFIGGVEADSDNATVNTPCPAARVPALTTAGIAVLVGLLSIIATSVIVRKKR